MILLTTSLKVLEKCFASAQFRNKSYVRNRTTKKGIKIIMYEKQTVISLFKYTHMLHLKSQTPDHWLYNLLLFLQMSFHISST